MSKKIKYSLDSKFAVWFKEFYEDDPWADDINPEVTFKELLDILEAKTTGDELYDAMGADDSCVREALFNGLSDITKKPYEYFYDLYFSVELDYDDDGIVFEDCDDEDDEVVIGGQIYKRSIEC